MSPWWVSYLKNQMKWSTTPSSISKFYTNENQETLNYFGCLQIWIEGHSSWHAFLCCDGLWWLEDGWKKSWGFCERKRGRCQRLGCCCCCCCCCGGGGGGGGGLEIQTLQPPPYEGIFGSMWPFSFFFVLYSISYSNLKYYKKVSPISRIYLKYLM